MLAFYLQNITPPFLTNHSAPTSHRQQLTTNHHLLSETYELINFIKGMETREGYNVLHENRLTHLESRDNHEDEAEGRHLHDCVNCSRRTDNHEDLHTVVRMGHVGDAILVLVVVF